MAATSGSDWGRCMKFEGGKMCSCQLWEPSSDHEYRCGCCKCHMSFHKRSNPNGSVAGRCLRLNGEGLSASKDGCQEFSATADGAILCEGCKCHKNYHAQPEVVPEIVACVDSGNSSDCDNDGRGRILEDAAAERCSIFLCHALAQENFAADLCYDLERRNLRAYFDKGCSIKEFQKQFYKVIKHCRVVVVILSEEFFTESKRPMLELVAIMRERQKRGPKLRVVPVFYGSSFDACLEKWKITNKEQRTESDQTWPDVLKTLTDVGGVRMGDSEEGFREDVVSEVRKFFPSPEFDVSKMQGKSRLCKEVLDVVYPKNSLKDPIAGVRVVGLHGIPGSGKTTLCCALCNMLSEKFDGKVCIVDAGSIGKKSSEGSLLRKVLDKVGNLKAAALDSVEISGGMAFRRYFKSEANFERKAFLVVDNVTDHPPVLEVARVLKGAALAKGSMVLVTTRSLDVLKGLGIEESDCMSMPDLREEEAKSLFLDCADVPVNARNGVDENLLKRFLKKCMFLTSGGRKLHYHPFALKVIGSNLSTGRYNPDVWKKKLDGFKRSRWDQGEIFELLRSSFDSLEEEDRLLFMDFALFLPHSEQLPSVFSCIMQDGKYFLKIPDHERLENLFEATEWLSIVHGKQPHEVSAMIGVLVRKSFLEVFVSNDQRILSMHDLVREFALHLTKDAKRSWVYKPRNCNYLPRSDSLDNVRSVCLGFDGWKSSKKVNLNMFPNAQAMTLRDVVPDIAFRVDELEGLKSLEVLVNEFDFESACQSDNTEVPPEIRLLTCGTKGPVVPLRVDGLRRLRDLVFLRCLNVAYSACIDEIGDLINLRVLDLVGYGGESLPNLSKLTKLGKLNLRDCKSLRTIDLQNLPELMCLDVEFTGIRKLDLSGCMSLRRVWGLRYAACLEELNLSRCHSLEELPNLRMCKSLRLLWMPDCWLVQSLRGLSGLRSLQMLDITGCEAMTELRGIRGCEALMELRASGCENLARLPILPNLQVIDIGPETEMVEQETEDEEEEEDAGAYDFVIIGEDKRLGVLRRGLLGSSDMAELSIEVVKFEMVPSHGQNNVDTRT